MRIRLSLLLGLAALFWSAPADATVLLYMNTQQLTAESSIVISGVVLRQQVVEDKKHLFTDSYIKVDQVLKGSVERDAVVRVREAGGETPLLGEYVAGTPRFVVGENVFLFAQKSGRDQYRTTGMCLGKYTIKKDKDGVVQTYRDFTGAALARFDKQGKFAIEPELSKNDARPGKLSDLVALVRRLLAAGGAR